MKRKLTATFKDDGYIIHPVQPDGFRIRLQSGTKKYQVDCGRSSGRHIREPFETIAEARQWANEKYKERDRIGKQAFTLTDTEKLDASRAMEIAKKFPRGKSHVTLREMALFFEVHHRTTDHTRKTGELITQYLGAQEKRFQLGELRETSLSSCRQFLSKGFKDTFGERAIDTITHKDIDAFLDALVFVKEDKHGQSVKVGVANRKSHKTYIGGFFKWVQKHHDVLPISPMPKTRSIRQEKDDPDVYSVAEVKTMLKNTPKELVPYMAVQLFGGARATEATRIRYEYISWRTNEIKLPKEATKGRRGRILHMKPNLAKILAEHRPDTDKGLLCNMPVKTIEKRLRELREAHGIRNIHSGFRHGFCTYSVAKFGVEKTMMESGHKSSQLIVDHYLSPSLNLKEDAEEYFNIGLDKEKVVQFKDG